MNIKKEINNLIKKYDLSREDIASKIGVSAMSIYRWEKGLVQPKSRIIIRAIEQLKKELSK